MNIFLLVWSYLKSKPLNTVVNILLLGLGIAVITILLLVRNQLEEKIQQNARGIDLVVGAKGSPMQLILCNIFHADFPTGNIKLAEAEKISRNRLVKTAIPLALGDSYAGFRIIGTNEKYASVYEAKLQSGRWWKKPMEVTIGSTVASTLNLHVNDQFASTHGLLAEGHAHEDQKFIVTGILTQSSTLLDNLILTSIESVWAVHEDDATHGEMPDIAVTHPSPLVESVQAGDSLKEITSLLIEYKSPMGAIQLPRLVNTQSSLQAASPAFETARLFSIIGVGVEILTGFAYVLIFISGLSIFIALYNSLKERKYDLAIMRTMGATRSQLVFSVLLEGLLLTFLGTFLGIMLSHGVLMLMANYAQDLRNAGFSGLTFYPFEWMILAASLLLGLLCALIPAVQAYRTDISQVLAGN
jgi:putative ABC transport system permease protein